MIKNKHRGACSGFSLLEVLVGLIILAIGLLGLAGMQMKSLRHNNEAYLRSQATLQTYDIMDRMRANRENIQDYEIDFEDEAPSDPASRAEKDLKQWRGTLAIFPGPGSGEIEVDGPIVTVKIRWRELDNPEDPEDPKHWTEFATQSEL